MRKISFIMLVAVCSYCCVNNAQATVYFQDDFESNTTVSTSAWPDASGDYDPDNAAVGTWSTVEGASISDVQVSSFSDIAGWQPTSAHSGSNYIIAGYHWETYANWNHRGLPCSNLTVLVDRAIIDFWAWGWQGMHNQFQGKELANYGGANAFYMTLTGNGSVNWHNGTTWQTANSTWTAGQWNHIVIDLDLTANTATVTVNDVSQTFNSRYGAAPTLGSIRYNGDTTAFFDDFLITPEPTTLVLLGLGAVSLLRRRSA